MNKKAACHYPSLLKCCQNVQWHSLVSGKVYHWCCVARQLSRIYILNTFIQVYTVYGLGHMCDALCSLNTQTHTIQCHRRQKTGKTCGYACLSKQLHQIETKLNLKPRATRATERLWQIWQGRKGSAARSRDGGNAGWKDRCGSQRKRDHRQK